MKKLLGLLLPLVFLLPACEKRPEERPSEVEVRVAELEAQITEVNSQVSFLQQLLGGEYFVQSVTELPDGAGYKMVLVDENGGNAVEKTVLDGKDAKSADVGIRQDSDAHFYWTLCGQWLLLGGQKVRADAQEDGLTPEFEVRTDGYWYVRQGSGAWQKTGSAYADVNGPIVALDAISREDVVVITLTGGVVIEIPKVVVPVKLQILVDNTAFRDMNAGEKKSTAYEVKATRNVSVTLDSWEPQGWTVTFSAPKDNKGTVEIAVPSGAILPAKVLLIASGSDGSSFVTVISVGNAGTSPDDPADDSFDITDNVDSGAGSLLLPAGADDVVIPSSASAWISLSGNTLVIAENTGYDSRTAVVTFAIGDTSCSYTVVQAQKDAIVLSSNSVTANPEGDTLPFVLQANVTVSAATDASWLVVSPLTKGLASKEFTLTVQANESGAAREGHITFSFEEITQTVTVSQEAMAVEPDYDYGFYLDEVNWVYEPGIDQMVRSYDGDDLTFVIVNPAVLDWISVSGYSTSLTVGSAVTVEVVRKTGVVPVLSQEYSMRVLKESGLKVWIGDGEGHDIVFKK